LTKEETIENTREVFSMVSSFVWQTHNASLVYNRNKKEQHAIEEAANVRYF